MITVREEEVKVEFTGQDINDEAQPAVSQAEGVTSVLLLLSLPEAIILFRYRVQGRRRRP